MRLRRGLGVSLQSGAWVPGKGVTVAEGSWGLGSIECLSRGVGCGGTCHQGERRALVGRWGPRAGGGAAVVAHPFPGYGDGCSVGHGLSASALWAGPLSKTFCWCLGNLFAVRTQHIKDAVMVVCELAGASWCTGWVQNCIGADAESFK